MRRRYVISLVVVSIIAFLAISALLARALSVSGAEDAAITSLVRAEARGNTDGVISLIAGCAERAACRARAQRLTSALHRPGVVAIVQIQNSAGFTLGPTVGTARVAWVVGSSLPRTQCVRVRHAGNVISGFRIQLVRVSVRIVTDAACPARF